MPPWENGKSALSGILRGPPYNALPALLWKLGLLKCIGHRFRPRLRSGSAGLVFTCSLSWCLRKPQLGPYCSACLVSHVMRDTHMCWTRNTVPRLALFPLSLKSSLVHNHYVSGKLRKGLYWLFARNLRDVGLTERGSNFKSHCWDSRNQVSCGEQKSTTVQLKTWFDVTSLMSSSVNCINNVSGPFLLLYRHAYVYTCPSTSLTGHCDNQAIWWPEITRKTFDRKLLYIVSSFFT